MSAIRTQLEQLALEQHMVKDGEYGCPGLTCPGVQKLIAFGERCAAAQQQRCIYVVERTRLQGTAGHATAVHNRALHMVVTALREDERG